MGFEAKATAVVLGLWLSLVVYLLLGLRDGSGLSKADRRPRKGDKLFGMLGVLMTALDDALARFNTFVKDVITQLRGASATNETQTAKIAELQGKLDAALSDDAADKAAIAALQAEIAGLQDEVAAQINSAIDALSNPLPVVDPAEPPVTPDITVPGIGESSADPGAVE